MRKISGIPTNHERTRERFVPVECASYACRLGAGTLLINVALASLARRAFLAFQLGAHGNVDIFKTYTHTSTHNH